MNEGKAVVDESRAYQLARELSLLGINGQGGLNHVQIPGVDTDHTFNIPQIDFEDNINMHNGHVNLPLESSDCMPHDINSMAGLNQEVNGGLFPSAAASRKSANMTETVPVPSSEHVAEIVGRQG